ncbi:MAG: hypothetical protein KDE35_07120 [Geminicoccaceae bacterium]|nr:hypothetical protein [Geminicoccaceae bacterium]
MIELLLQGALAVLLCCTILWCALVHRRLAGLREDQGELRQLILALDQATSLAEKRIAEMRQVTLQGERRAREQEALVAGQAEALRRLMARATQIALKLERSCDPPQATQSASPTLVDEHPGAPATPAPERRIGTPVATPDPVAAVRPRRSGSAGASAASAARVRTNGRGRDEESARAAGSPTRRAGHFYRAEDGHGPGTGRLAASTDPPPRAPRPADDAVMRQEMLAALASLRR